MIKTDKRPQYDAHTLRRIYLGTDGCCHICRRKLILEHYARPGIEGAWEVERLVPSQDGGNAHMDNLKPACTLCSLEHGAARPPQFGAKTGSAR